MRRSKRAAALNSQYPMDQSRNKKEKVVSNTDPSLIHRTLTTEEELQSLLNQCFDQMLPHLWFKAVPSSKDDVSNIAFAMRQRWELIQALLVRLKYINKYGDSFRIN